MGTYLQAQFDAQREICNEIPYGYDSKLSQDQAMVKSLNIEKKQMLLSCLITKKYQFT